MITLRENASGGVEHPDGALVIDELEEVAVTGHHVHGARSTVTGGQRSDDIICLEAGRPEASDTERRERIDDQRHLR